ncbi:GT-D fold domain-containing glycosyltransferase [Lachnospiraceae bacterium JLR.KK008]
MKNVYIFGVGKGKETVREYLIEDNVRLLGYIDNNAHRFPDGVDGKRVYRLEEIADDFDYIIVSVMRYQYIDEQLSDAGIRRDRIIHFFSYDDAIRESYWVVLNKNGWRLEAMSFEFEKKTRPYSQNMIYELADPRSRRKIEFPKISPAQEAVALVCREHRSLVRFGDGEFELMRMKVRSKFQSANGELAERMREILRSDTEEVLIAIADNYGSLDRYTEAAAEDIRAYMTPQTRREHMALLDLEKTYYDAYLSRPYMIYRDKEAAGGKFEALRQIWRGRDVLIVEGGQTRMGVGNDLLADAHSVRRILGPSVNAYDKYAQILACVKETAERGELILLALGATASVLAYDLACDGFWAVDIGHLDLEYEWYHAGLRERCDIPYKYVNEIYRGNQVCELPETLREDYEKQIVRDLS